MPNGITPNETLVFFEEFTFHEMAQNTCSHRGPQRRASVVESSFRLARIQGLQHVTNLLPRAFQHIHVERRDGRSAKTLTCVRSSPELRFSFIMTSSSTCPIPSRSSWPPLPDSYSQTPGGTLFSTTPGGEMKWCIYF